LWIGTSTKEPADTTGVGRIKRHGLDDAQIPARYQIFETLAQVARSLTLTVA
jgi:hypothetical protein